MNNNLTSYEKYLFERTRRLALHSFVNRMLIFLLFVGLICNSICLYKHVHSKAINLNVNEQSIEIPFTMIPDEDLK